MKNIRLDGKVALVTGATSGLGEAIARGFADAGAKVALCGRRAKEGEAVAASIREGGGEALFVTCDVGDSAQVESFVRRAVEAYGRVDVAMNNAGLGSTGEKLADLSDEVFDAMIQVNLRGVWVCMKHEIRQMVAQGSGGSIINMGSVLGQVTLSPIGQFSSGHYIAAKHGIEGLTKAGAVDYGRDGIRVNTLAPGIIETPMAEENLAADAPFIRHWRDSTALGRFGKVDDVVGAAVFLASDAAAYITGTHLVVDGGYLAQ